MEFTITLDVTDPQAAHDAAKQYGVVHTETMRGAGVDAWTFRGTRAALTLLVNDQWDSGDPDEQSDLLAEMRLFRQWPRFDVVRRRNQTHNLGEITGRLFAIVGRLDAFFDDPITRQSGCGDELIGGVVRGVLRDTKACLDGYGMTLAEWEDEMRVRVSPKWFYFSYASAVANLFAEEYGAAVTP